MNPLSTLYLIEQNSGCLCAELLLFFISFSTELSTHVHLFKLSNRFFKKNLILVLNLNFFVGPERLYTLWARKAHSTDKTIFNLHCCWCCRKRPNYVHCALIYKALPSASFKTPLFRPGRPLLVTSYKIINGLSFCKWRKFPFPKNPLVLKDQL